MRGDSSDGVPFSKDLYFTFGRVNEAEQGIDDDLDTALAEVRKRVNRAGRNIGRKRHALCSRVLKPVGDCKEASARYGITSQTRHEPHGAV